MKKIILICTAILVVCSVLPFLPLYGESKVYTDTIRLHVLANSDSDEDQALKLKVRDVVLDAVGHLTSGCRSKEEAERVIGDNLGILTDAAKDAVALEGSDYDVKLTFDTEQYPEREYDGVRLPAGKYTSLRVLIGDAAGHNWWCVLYPPLCVSAAEPVEELAEAGFTGEQIRVLCDNENPKYVLRFRILEFIESIFG